MKKRNPLAVFFLSIITFSIYDIYWLVKTKEELNKKTKQHIPTIWLLIVPGLVLIAGYIGYIIDAVSNSTVTTSTTTYGSSVSSSGHSSSLIVFTLLLIFGAIATFCISLYWFFRFSKAVNEYTNSKMSTAVTFLILWLIHLIGVALIQDTFNDMIDSGTVPGEGALAGSSAPQTPPLYPDNQTTMVPATPTQTPTGPTSFPASQSPTNLPPSPPTPQQTPVSPQPPTESFQPTNPLNESSDPNKQPPLQPPSRPLIQ
jgi:flagellar basal body-associated protein FliL